MLKNYITIALRNLRRQFMYSVINILGLAVGMACSLIIFLYVYGEWSYDRHFENADRIHRIGISFFNMGNFANGPELLGDFLPKEFEGIETFTRFKKSSQELVKVNDQSFKEVVYYADSAFFKVFSYDFVAGNRNEALNNLSSAVMTESMALKYFKSTDVIGKTIEIGKEKMPYMITGIVKDDFRNSHLKASIWLSLTIDRTKSYYWTSASIFNYALLRENTTIDDLKKALDQIVANHVYPDSKGKESKVSLEDYLKDPNSVKFLVHPLKDIYLKSKLSLELSPGGNETNVYIFGVISIFILVLAGVNFINLSTARASRRAKEVGVRKSLGTSRGMLVSQFLLESVIISLFSMVLALCLAELFTFVFFWITGQQLSVSLWSNATSIIGVFIFAIAVGVLAGIYPAFYLTAFQTVKVLKGNTQQTRSQTFRNSLVVFQFTISIALIICSAIIIRQLNFIAEKDLGFNQSNVLSIDHLWLLPPNSAFTFKEQMSKQHGVINASLHSGEPGNKSFMSFYTYQTAEMQNALTVNTYLADHNYLDVLGFKLLKGRNFDEKLASDTASVILNESAVRALNITGDPIGVVLNKTTTIIGIVSDFHWESLRSPIAPLAIVLKNERSKDDALGQLFLKLNSSNATTVLKAAENYWKQFAPDEPMVYHFLDDNFGTLLKKEAILGKAIGFFTGIAIIISCLGLFGLAAYTTEQRTKEIGIRKVLGASVSNIVMLLNKQFTILVLVSMLIAVPVSYYAANEWLSGFAYRIDLGVWIFLGGGLLGLLISYLTVVFHSIKASGTNPVETLKWE